MSNKRPPSIALKWTPPGKRKRGRPMGTWRTIEDVKAANKTWHETRWFAQDREEWRNFVAALCYSGSNEE